MICIKAEIPKELNNIDDEFLNKTKVMNKIDRETIYKEYQS
jgi:hypothetical protein